MEEKILTALRDTWDDLLKEGQEITFRKDQVLFYEGHAPYGIFALQSGSVEFTRGETRCPEDHQGPSSSSVLGIKPFFDETPYCCTCRASDDCKVIFISKTQLLPLKKSRTGV